MRQYGRAFASSHMGGVQGLSKSNEARHFNRVVRKFGLAFQVPTSGMLYTFDGETVELPYFRPVDFLGKLLRDHAYLLLGGHDRGLASRRALHDFWHDYQNVQGTHAFFGDASWTARAPFTIPYCLHGDGGRTAKKQPLELISLEPVLGLMTASAPSQRCRCEVPTELSTVRLNSKFHSYLTRFLLVAFPAKQWPKGLLRHVMSVLSEELAHLFHTGISVDGRVYFFACLGLKGDMEFHAQSMNLTRSYHNVGTRRFKMVCVECHAGAEDVPFEDVNPKAAWESTICGTFPWTEDPPFSSLPFEDWRSLPSSAPCFFRRDPFHVFRLGTMAASGIFFGETNLNRFHMISEIRNCIDRSSAGLYPFNSSLFI